ncbi:hypothetical protein EPO15_13200 [bacterium]|nr:MAG: hypothetical protein EPO15_13200 [bacterium]
MIELALAAVVGVAPSAPRTISEFLKSAAPVRAASSCQRVDPVHAGGTQGYADGTSSGNCYVSISPIDTMSMVYRSFGVFGDGMLMVFNSFGEGENPAKFTGAREFHFFPRLAPGELRIDAAGPSVSVVLGDGGVLEFDPATAQPRAVDRGSVTVAATVDPSNRGGVEFPSYAGLMLDSGFRMGELPSMKPDWESTFRDAAGRTCTVKNSEVFSYADGDRELKFDDAALKAFLKTRCPKLAVPF